MALYCANQFKSAQLTANSYTTDRALPQIKWHRNKYRWVSLVSLACRLKRSERMWREEPSTAHAVKSLVQHVAVLGFFCIRRTRRHEAYRMDVHACAWRHARHLPQHEGHSFAFADM